MTNLDESHKKFSSRIDKMLQESMIFHELIPRPITWEGDVEPKSDLAKYIADHAFEKEYMLNGYRSMRFTPDGRFDEWKLVREWVWRGDDGEEIVLAMEFHKGYSCRVLFPHLITT